MASNTVTEYTEEDNNKFTFTWSIENFSFCFQRCGESFRSPFFEKEIMALGRWHIALYPRGEYMEKDDLSCYLCNSEGVNVVAIKFCLYIVSNRAYFVEYSFENIFGPGATRCGTTSFISRDILFRKKDMYLPNDTLTIQCQMWKVENKVPVCHSDLNVFHQNKTNEAKRQKLQRLDKDIISSKSELKKKTIGCSAHSCVTVRGAQFEYIGKLECNKSASVIIESPSLKLLLQIVDPEKKQILLSIKRRKNYDLYAAFASCQVQLFDRFEEKFLDKKFDFFFNDFSSVWKFYLDTTSVNFEDDNIDLKFDYRASTGEVKNDILHCNYKTVSPYCSLPQIKTSELSEYYLTQKHSDLKLVCSDKQELRAHKVILCVGSAVFKAMIDDDTKENTLTISNLSSGTMDLLLRYLYSGQYPDLEWPNALQLYDAANKYKVSELARHCSKLLKNQLAVYNLWEILLQADHCDDVELKSAALEFACLNLSEVIFSEGWKLISSTNAELSAEFMKYVENKICKH